MLNGIVGEAAFSEAFSLWLIRLGLSENAASFAATASVVTIITFVTIIFGELVPKRIGQIYTETVARLTARPMQFVALLTLPFVWLLVVDSVGLQLPIEQRLRRKWHQIAHLHRLTLLQQGFACLRQGGH